MKKNDHFLKIFITILTLGLIAISCQKKPEIEYDKSVKPITLEGKVLQSFSVNYAKDLTKDSVLKMASQLTSVSGKSLNFESIIDMNDGILALRNEEEPSSSSCQPGVANRKLPPIIYSRGVNNGNYKQKVSPEKVGRQESQK